MLQDAPSIISINPGIPIQILTMVSKLMNKYPEDRYQSAKGILHDLYMIASEYDSDNISDTPFIPQKLYGRSTEYNILTSVFT